MTGRVNTGGGTGATLTIKAPAGCTVTVSKDGKTKTKVAGSDGIVVFKWLATGTWTVTITDGGQTSTKPVIITADYSTVIAFFSATIHVSYPSGSTCTATDGVTNLHAPDTSGTWLCVVPNAGTWTISCNDGSDTATATVEISDDGQSEAVTLAYVLPYFYKDGDAKVDLQFYGAGENTDGYITITADTATEDARKPEAYFVIPEIEKYGTISCVINSYMEYTPVVSIRQISTGSNVATATPSSQGETVRIDLSGLGLVGNDYYFVLHTKAVWHSTGSTNGYWTYGTVKTNHIWGDAK